MSSCYFQQYAIVATLLAFVTIPLRLTAEEIEVERHARIERLIEALASPNPAPEKRFAQSYDREAQAKVKEAWLALLKEGHAAFPELVAHADDQRYSCTLAGSAADVNFSVGKMCRQILRLQLEVYDNQIEPLGRWQPYLSLRDIKSWWKERQHKTLHELQVEAVEFALRSMKRVSSQDLEENFDADHAEQGKQENIKKLQRLLDDLNARKKPIVVDELGREMLGLPGDSYQPYFGK